MVRRVAETTAVNKLASKTPEAVWLCSSSRNGNTIDTGILEPILHQMVWAELKADSDVYTLDLERMP
jgi:hypothetical protein